MIRVIVGPDQILQDIVVDKCVVFCEVLPHLGFQCPVKSLCKARLYVIIFRGKEGDAVVM